MQDEYDYIMKLIIVGDSGVGKSTLLKMYCDHEFSESYISTIGVDFKIKTIQVNNKLIKLQIWDTAGQERFRSITNSYYNGTHAIMLVFDLTDVNSFNRLPTWLAEIDKYMIGKTHKIILIGNKSDDISKRQVYTNDIDAFAMNNNLLYFETSAKHNTNVTTAFIKIAEENINNTIRTYKKKPIPNTDAKPIEQQSICCY